MNVVGGLHEQLIKLQCRTRCHTTTINYGRKLQNISCFGCNLDEKNELKEKLRQEEEKRNEQNRIQQEKLFAQAQEFMAHEQTNNPNWNNNWQNDSYASSPQFGWQQQQKQQTYLHQQEQYINRKSAEQARAYLAKHQSLDGAKLTFDKVFLVYKFDATLQKTLVSGMEAMNSLEQAKQYFNKTVLMVHPDKNSHPLAETVFKKLREAFDTAKSTLKQRQQHFEQQQQNCSQSSHQTFNTQPTFHYSTATN